MFRGILVAVICLWFGSSALASVSYPPGKNPYANLQKRIAKMSKNEKAKTLEHIYHFMIRREANQNIPLVALFKEPVPDWLNSILWETADAFTDDGTAQNSKEVLECLNHGATTKNGIKYPNSCMFAGNIICTQSIPPKCNGSFIRSQRPDLICEGNTYKCNPDLIMECNDEKKKTEICVDPKEARVDDPRKGPKITLACLTKGNNDSKKTDKQKIEERAKNAAQCADFSDDGKVVQALQQIAKFCSSLAATDVDKRLEELEKETSGKIKADKTVPRRDGKGHFKSDFAGNDQDCLDMLNFIAALQKNKPVPVPPPPACNCDNHDPAQVQCGQLGTDSCGEYNVCAPAGTMNCVTAPPPPPPKSDLEIACSEFPSLCEGQDFSSCGSYIYNPGKKQRKECIDVRVTQEGNPAFKETPTICNDDVKDVSEAGRARQLGWINRTCRNFDWNDLGRSATGSSDGNPDRPDKVKGGEVVKWKDKFTEGLTDKRGNVDICWDASAGRYRASDYFYKYIDKTVTNPTQNAAIKQVFSDCANMNAKEMRRQGLPIIAGMDVTTAADHFARADTKWMMLRVADVTNTHMAVKRTTGVSDGKGNPVCSPSSPCTEGTFICAKIDRDGNIKNGHVAGFATIYSDRLRPGQEYGRVQYVETGTYQRPDLDKAERQKRDDNSYDGMKYKYEKCPVSISVFDADESRPFLEMNRPVVLRDEHSKGVKILTAGIAALHKPKQSVVYHARENICPEGASNGGRRFNKVVARKNDSGQIDSAVIVCDSETKEGPFAPWMWGSEPPKVEINGSNSSIKDMKMFNRNVGKEEILNLSYNNQKVGVCNWRWSDTDKPAVLRPSGETLRPQGSIKDNSRAIQSEGEPKIEETQKK